jgi:hypothetical protein
VGEPGAPIRAAADSPASVPSPKWSLPPTQSAARKLPNEFPQAPIHAATEPSIRHREPFLLHAEYLWSFRFISLDTASVVDVPGYCSH